MYFQLTARELTKCVEHGIGVNNGTDAIHLALRALAIGPGSGLLKTAKHACPFGKRFKIAGTAFLRIKQGRK